MLFIFFNLLKPRKTKIAKPIKIAIKKIVKNISVPRFPIVIKLSLINKLSSIFVIEKLKNPCDNTAIKMPVIKSLVRFLTSKKERERK